MASLLKSVSGTSVQRGDDVVEASLEQLEEEMIIKMISFLTPWEALALGATNKWMRGLVRAQQMVQTFVDISYPFIEDGDSRKSQLGEAIENTILSRFGPQLLKISRDVSEHNQYNLDGRVFKSAAFMEQLAIKCPNLIELPTDDFAMLLAYTRGRSSGIKKMTIRLIDSNDAIRKEVKVLLRATPLLEAVQLSLGPSNWFGPSEHSEYECIFLINEIEQTLLPTNCIRELGITYTYFFPGTITRLEIYPAIQHLVQKLHLLEQFTLDGSFHRQEDYEPIRRLFQSIECSKTLITDEKSPLNKCALKTYVRSTVRSLGQYYNHFTKQVVLDIANLNGYHEVCIHSRNEFKELLPPLVLPPCVRELVMDVGIHYYDYFASCIRDYGKKLHKIWINCDHVSGKPVNELLVSIAEVCSELESFKLVSFLKVVRGTNLTTFLASCGKTLKNLSFNPGHVSIGVLKVISQECKLLEKLDCTLHHNARKTSRVKKLIFKMDKLRKAEIHVLTEKGEFYGSCGHYTNRKLVFS